MHSCVHRQWADSGSGPVAQSHPMPRAGKRCQKSMVQPGPQQVLWRGVSPAGCSGQLSKAISIDFCCYRCVASSKNSSLHPKIQFNRVFLGMFCFTWDILGSKSTICSKPVPLSFYFQSLGTAFSHGLATAFQKCERCLFSPAGKNHFGLTKSLHGQHQPDRPSCPFFSFSITRIGTG